MKQGLVLLTALVCSFNAFAMGKPPAGDLPRFYEVAKDQVYRGAQPTNHGLELLAQMKIRTVLDLRNEDDDQIRAEGKYVKGLGMDFISVPMSGILSPSDRDIDYIEKVLTDPAAQPVFVHCMQGEDRTGLVIALYRVFEQKMAPKDAYSEMLHYGFHKALIGLNHYFEERTGFDD